MMGVLETIETTLFVLLIISQFFIFFKIFSYVNAAFFYKYRFLGPFALIIPGVLMPRGIAYLCTFVFISAVLLAIGVHMFHFDEIRPSDIQ
jgi:hypothetical protein